MENRTIRIVDAFAGIGGIRLGFETAAKKVGIDCVCASAIEFDKNSRKTYAANFGHEPQFDDITAIEDLSVIPDHDILLGGFPCQVFSRNGKFYNKNDRTLGDDDRKNLVGYLLRILSIKQPAAFLFENVKEILTIKNSDGSSFFETLQANIADLGYTMKPLLLDAKDFGLPQQRRRVYMVGFKNPEVASRFVEPSKQQKITCIKDILQNPVGSAYHLDILWRKRKNVKLPGMRLEALRLAYQSPKWENERAATCPTMEISPVAIIYGDTPSGLPRQQDKLYSQWGVSPTIATFSTPPIDVDGVWRLLTPRECARLQGLPDTFLIPDNDHVAYHQIGNGVAQNVVVAVATSMLEALGYNS